MNRELLEKLNGLKKKDVDTRNKLMKEGKLHGVYEEEMQLVHIENARVLNEIIEIEGWPGISKVGIEGTRAA